MSIHRLLYARGLVPVPPIALAIAPPTPLLTAAEARKFGRAGRRMRAAARR